MSIEEVTNWFDDFESSNLEKIGYHGGYLYVVFKSGGIYRYPNVESQVFTAFKLADSKGKYFGSVIKKYYEVYERLDLPAVGKKSSKEKPEWLKTRTKDK